MKILSVITYYAPHWTGMTRHATLLAEGLAARGHHITVLTTRHDPALPRREARNGVHVVRVRPLLRANRGMIAPGFVPMLARLVRVNDAMHIHTPLPEALPAAMLCRRSGRPLLMTHHGDVVMPDGMVNQAIRVAMNAGMRGAARYASHITAYSRDYAAYSPLLRPFSAKLTPIYPPVSIPGPCPAHARAWRRSLGLGEKVVIGFAGRFVEEKGFDFLLRAMPSLIAAEPRIHLLYAGEYSISYERFYERCGHLLRAHVDRITMLGLLRERQELADFYAMCDVFALPSRTDCFALVQVEAMLCGVPVVATDIPGAREAVRATGMGVLVAPNSPTALASGLLAVLRNPVRYRMSPELIRAVFDSERTLDQYEGVFAELSRAQRASPP